MRLDENGTILVGYQHITNVAKKFNYTDLTYYDTQIFFSLFFFFFPEIDHILYSEI